MSNIDKEWLQQKIAEMEAARDEIPFGLDEDDSNTLAALRIALASLEAKPIGAFHIADQQVDGTSDYIKDGEWPIDDGVIEVYAAPPAPVSVPDERAAFNAWNNDTDCPIAGRDAKTAAWLAWSRRASMLQGKAEPVSKREKVRRDHAEWSDVTFGNVGPVGPLKHLSKEALEAAEQPGDLSEWADMHFLLWDAQRRAGITDEQITQAMIEKLAINKQRSWPEPKDGEPRLHIKEQPRKKVDRCDVCTEGARGGCGTCIFNGNFE
ncbi:DUF550 domain-containing protein [Escherichia coli]